MGGECKGLKKSWCEMVEGSRRGEGLSEGDQGSVRALAQEGWRVSVRDESGGGWGVRSR